MKGLTEILHEMIQLYDELMSGIMRMPLFGAKTDADD